MTIPHSLSPARLPLHARRRDPSSFPATLLRFVARLAQLTGVILLASGAMAVDGWVHAEPVHIVRPHNASAAAPYAEYIREAGQRFGVPASWIGAVMAAESGRDARARSPKGAMGLMQIMPDTWAGLRARHGLGTNPYDPRDNIHAGAAYMREMLDRFGSAGFLSAYNAGPGQYEEHLATGRPLPPETRLYVAMLAPVIGQGQAGNPVPASRRVTTWQDSPLIVRGSQDKLAAAPAFIDRAAVSRSVAGGTARVPHVEGLLVLRGGARRSP